MFEREEIGGNVERVLPLADHFPGHNQTRRFAPEGINWDQSDPSSDRPNFVPIWSPRAGEGGISGIFVSTHITAVWTHWYEDRTGPCLTDEAKCPGCRAGLSKRRKGYALALDGLLKLGLIEVTQEVLRMSPFLLSPQYQLRGRRFRATRLGQQRNSRVTLTVYDYRPGDGELLQNLPPDEDIRPYLLRIWGYQA